MKMYGIVSGVNFWAWSGEALPAKPYGSLWKEGDDLLGGHPHEEQGWYGVYQTDQSTLNLVKSYSHKIKLHEKKK
jgi:mannan endo-1,4-beta-mannosidase